MSLEFYPEDRGNKKENIYKRFGGGSAADFIYAISETFNHLISYTEEDMLLANRQPITEFAASISPVNFDSLLRNSRYRTFPGHEYALLSRKDGRFEFQACTKNNSHVEFNRLFLEQDLDAAKRKGGENDVAGYVNSVILLGRPTHISQYVATSSNTILAKDYLNERAREDVVVEDHSLTERSVQIFAIDAIRRFREIYIGLDSGGQDT